MEGNFRTLKETQNRAFDRGTQELNILASAIVNISLSDECMCKAVNSGTGMHELCDSRRLKNNSTFVTQGVCKQ